MPRIEKELIVKNPQGLHARPAALFVQIASRYNAKITVTKNGESVNGKSIMGLLMLGAQHNSSLMVIAEGEDAEKAIQEITEFLNQNG